MPTPHRAMPPGAHPLPLEQLHARALGLTKPGIPTAMLGTTAREEVLPVPVLEALLHHERIPLTVRDRVWAHLIGRARREGGDWYLLALGAAMGRLRAEALRLAPRGSDPALVRTVHHHLAAEYVLAIGHIDTGRPNIGRRLVWIAAYWTRKQLRTHAPGWVDLDADPRRLAAGTGEQRRADELHRVLVGLVGRTRQVKPSRSDRRPKLTRLDAALLALCCLEGHTVTQAAAQLGITPAAARGRLPRAKRTVATLLGHPTTRAQ